MGLSLDASVIQTGIINPHRLPPMGDGGPPDWTEGFPTYDERYVNVDGDEMTGQLTLAAEFPANSLLIPAGAGAAHLDGSTFFGNFGDSPSADGEVWIYKNTYIENGANVEMSGGGDFSLSDGSDLLLFNPSKLVLGHDPTIPLEAATKQYVDAQVGTKLDLATADARFVNVTGDSMTGPLVITSDTMPQLRLAPATTGNAVNIGFGGTTQATSFGSIAASPTLLAIDHPTQMTLRAGTGAPHLSLLGGATPLTVSEYGIQLPTDAPAAARHAAPKSYVDTQVGARVPTTRTISTTAPLTGGGDLSADRTLAITNFAGSAPGAVPTSPGGTTTFLRADGTWAAPPSAPASVPLTRLINTTAPLTGGGDLSTDRTLAITAFAGSAPGAVPTSPGGTTAFLRADGTWAAPTVGAPDWTLGFPTYDPRYVNVDGDTMTGTLNVPTVSSGALTTLALVGGSTGVTVVGNGRDTALMRDGIIWVGNINDATNNSAAPLRVYGTATQDQIQFFHGAAPQSMSGWVGFNTATEMRLSNNVGNLLSMACTGDVRIMTGGSETARAVGNNFVVGKTAADGAGSIGSEMRADGQLISNANAAGATNLFAVHTGGMDANGQRYARFMRSAGVSDTIGTILQVNTTGVSFNTTSDRRLKTIIGPVPDALDRLNALRPYRINWHTDPERPDSDALIADEVSDLVPGAVFGEPDAVDDDGNPEYQMLDYSSLVPLLIAAVQELTGRLNALEAA